MSEIQRSRSNISTLKERRPPEGPLCASHATKNSMKRASRLKMEEAEAKYRHQEDRAEAEHRRWKERVHTWAGVSLLLGIVLLCTAVLLLNYPPEDKKWASSILTHGAAALTTYFGLKVKSRAAPQEN